MFLIPGAYNTAQSRQAPSATFWYGFASCSGIGIRPRMWAGHRARFSPVHIGHQSSSSYRRDFGIGSTGRTRLMQTWWGLYEKGNTSGIKTRNPYPNSIGIDNLHRIRFHGLAGKGIKGYERRWLHRFPIELTDPIPQPVNGYIMERTKSLQGQPAFSVQWNQWLHFLSSRHKALEFAVNLEPRNELKNMYLLGRIQITGHW